MPKKNSTIYVDGEGKAQGEFYTPILCRVTMSQRVRNWYTSLWPFAKPWVITALLKMRNAITKLIDKLY